MPAQAIQSHSRAIWRESAAAGGAPTVTLMFWRTILGTSAVLSTVGPAQWAFADQGGGEWLLMPVEDIPVDADRITNVRAGLNTRMVVTHAG